MRTRYLFSSLSQIVKISSTVFSSIPPTMPCKFWNGKSFILRLFKLNDELKVVRMSGPFLFFSHQGLQSEVIRNQIVLLHFIVSIPVKRFANRWLECIIYFCWKIDYLSNSLCLGIITHDIIYFYLWCLLLVKVTIECLNIECHNNGNTLNIDRYILRLL